MAREGRSRTLMAVGISSFVAPLPPIPAMAAQGRGAHYAPEQASRRPARGAANAAAGGRQRAAPRPSSRTDPGDRAAVLPRWIRWPSGGSKATVWGSPPPGRCVAGELELGGRGGDDAGELHLETCAPSKSSSSAGAEATTRGSSTSDRARARARARASPSFVWARGS
jgi:hypothetical protein